MISILYVDDETTLLEVTRVYLERAGDFTVETRTSAKDAITLLETTTFDAIVSDYQMPVMDGIAFLKHIRSTGSAVPFILFTGKGREEVAIEALNSGADFYLQKGGEPKSQFAELTSKLRQAVQRRQAEKALYASEEKYRDLVENINDVIFSVDVEGSITYISPRISEYGYTADQMIGKPISEFILPDDLASVQARFGEVQNGILHPFEFQIRDASGKTRFVLTSSRPIFSGDRFIGLHGLMTDITDQKTAEAKITASEQRYRNVFEAAGDAMLVMDHGTGKILDVNSAASQIFLYDTEELKGMNHADILEDAGVTGEDAQTGVSGTPLHYYRRKDGTLFPAEVLASTYPQKKCTISILSLRDITLQKRAEERMIAAQRLYAVLSQINQSIIRVKDLQALVDEICRISIDFGRFRMAWVGLLDREEHTFRPVAHAGNEDGYLAAIEISVSGDEKSQGPTGTALRDGRYNICNDIETDPRMQPWRDEALKRGYRSSAAFPFRLHGEVVGAYNIYASEKDFFNHAEIALLEEIAMDISFALDMLDEQARRTHAENALAGSEERAQFLAEVLELSSQPFGVGYPGGGFGIVNPALCDLLGYTESEMHELTWFGITPPEYHERETKAIQEISQTGIPQRYEKEFFRKDGSRVPVEVFIHRMIDDGGSIRFFYGFVTDISERIRVQKILKAERDRAQQYLDTASVMLAAVNPSGIITLINRKGCEILGYSEEELIGRNWLETCLPERVQDDVKQVFEQVVSGNIEPVAYHENAVLTKSGEERILAFHNTLQKDEDATILGIYFSGEDITLRKQMEQSLRESEERFRNLIQNSSDMIRIIGKDGLVTYSSPSTRAITGYDPYEIIGKSPLDFIHPDDRKTVADALLEVMEQRNPGKPTEFRIRHADGSYCDVETIATNLLDVAGINGIVTTTRLITERKKAEKALLESEGRYRAIFEKSADAIFVTGEHILDCNPQAERMFGCSRDELLGTTAKDFSPEEQPCGRASDEMISGYLKAAWGGSVQTFSWVHCTKDRHLFPAQVTLIPTQVQGEPRIISIIHDCSVQDREDQLSRHLARFPDLNPDPVIEISLSRDITYANPASLATLKNLGMPPNPAAFIPEDFDVIISSVPDGETTRFTREVRIGTALFGEALSYDPEDKRFRIYAHEITTRAFEASALEQANRKLNLLSSITRHDIKNKLTGVMGYLELARGSTRDPEMIEYLSRAEISATAIKQQIEFTKEYENLGVKTPVWQDVSLILDGAVKLLERGAVSVKDEISGLEIYADPMLSKVLYCLLENALKHGDRITTIRVHGSPVQAGYLLVVEDNGVGVKSELKEKIFNKNVGKGEGFGLFLAREILSITGITLAETGDPGAGARFEISVPIGKFHVKSPE